METKKYSSYAQIEHDLKILKVEKEIYYQKTLSGIDKIKQFFVPSKAMTFATNIFENVFSGTTGMIVKTLIPMVVSWYMNRKRGD